MKLKMACFAIGMAAFLSPLWGQTSNPVTGTPGTLNIQITAVQGGGQYRLDSSSKWQKLAPGAHFVEGVELRTGAKGSIQFTVGTDQVYRIDRLTAIKVLRASLRPDGTIKTDVGMAYGRVSKDVDAPSRPHEDTIITPSSTLAVRGTRVSMYDQPPFEPEAISLTGTAFANLPGLLRGVTFGAAGQGTSAVTQSHPDAADQKHLTNIVDPAAANARTPGEQPFVVNVATSGRVNSVMSPLTFPTLSNTGMPTDTQLANLVSGDLIFAIRWNTNTHVQIGLETQGLGEFAFPVLNLNQTRTGGTIPFDNLGGPGGGYEVLKYPTKSFPDGLYLLNATNLGTTATTVTYNAYIVGPNGTLIPQEFYQDFINQNLSAVVQPTQVVQPGATNGQVEFAPVNKEDPNSGFINLFEGGGAGGGSVLHFQASAKRTVPVWFPKH
jgi:hypothetical protein